MELEEHFYSDDPAIGHPDVRTRLADTDYFFLGNGRILAAVQACRSGEGTPVGLIILDPNRFGPKRAALTCSEEDGITGTGVRIGVGDTFLEPDPTSVRGKWDQTEGVPTVRIDWKTDCFQITERFFCRNLEDALLVREVEIGLAESATDAPGEPVSLHVGDAAPSEFRVSPVPGMPATATLIHRIRQAKGKQAVESHWSDPVTCAPTARNYWTGLATVHTGDEILDHLFNASRNHLPVTIDNNGRMDGSIWQYNLEWVRDQSHVAEAFVRLGDYEKARTMLVRLVDEFVSPEGDTVDSGMRRPHSEVELDQNGELLLSLSTYVDWTGDLELVESRWEKIRTIAAFPFTDPFLHRPSGLLHNSREYWERHGIHGIEDGFELMSQFFVALGLEAAARLADQLGHDADRERWEASAQALKRAILEDPAYRLIENGHFIKRRGVDGAWQETIRMESNMGLPEGIPLLQDSPHYLDPDASSALPIAHAFVDPEGEVATATLAHIEELWNQWWDGGGYGRYNASGEPDSPGAWPFATLFVARAYAEAGDDEKVWRILHWLAATYGGRSGAWFENDGPRFAPPYPQVGMTPWTWAEMITLFVHHLLGVRPDRDGVTIRPRLLEGLGGMEASLIVRGHRIGIRCRAAEPGGEREGRLTDTEGAEPIIVPWTGDGIRIPLPTSDLLLDLSC